MREVELRSFDLESGSRGTFGFMDEDVARDLLAKFAAARRAARKPNGSYPSLVHFIRRDSPSVNPQ